MSIIRGVCAVVTALAAIGVHAGGDEYCSERSLNEVAVEHRFERTQGREFPLVLPGNLRLHLNDVPALVLHNDDLVLIRGKSGYTVAHRVVDGFKADGEVLSMSKLVPYIFEYPQHLVESAEALTSSEKAAVKANKLVFDLGCAEFLYKASFTTGVIYAIGRDESHHAFLVAEGGRVHQVDFKGATEQFSKLLGSLTTEGQ